MTDLTDADDEQANVPNFSAMVDREPLDFRQADLDMLGVHDEEDS